VITLIQVGNRIVNLAHVTWVDLSPLLDRVTVYLSVAEGQISTGDHNSVEGSSEAVKLIFHRAEAEALRKYFAGLQQLNNLHVLDVPAAKGGEA
jgi:hypothetical protein